MKTLYCGGALRFLQKISLRRRESRLAARASHSAVAVDFLEPSLSVIPSAYTLLMTASKVVFSYLYTLSRRSFSEFGSLAAALTWRRPYLILLRKNKSIKASEVPLFFDYFLFP